ncbi:MAG: SDR family oxidoreductase [Thermoguttaceae bacterium]
MKIAVTGAFGYSGKRIAKHLLDQNHTVITLTNSKPETDPFNGKVEVHPMNFNEQDKLQDALSGCDAFINTYWVRFNHNNFTHEDAIRNTFSLFNAAKNAGVKHIVHTSIANPSLNSPFEYYRGKARIEKHLTEIGVSYSILRPTVIFGPDDILINNIAWSLRKFPVLGYFGDGKYRIRAIHVDDFARLAAKKATDLNNENEIIDAVGPEDYTYLELLKLIGSIIGKKRVLAPVPIFAGYAVAQLIGWYHSDIFLTREEIGGLMANLLTTNSPATGEIKLSEWLRENANSVGLHYASELARRK